MNVTSCFVALEQREFPGLNLKSGYPYPLDVLVPIDDASCGGSQLIGGELSHLAHNDSSAVKQAVTIRSGKVLFVLRNVY